MASNTVCEPVSRTDWEVRFQYGVDPYDNSTDCRIMWYPDLRSGPFCHQLAGHSGDHEGFGLKWSRSPRVDVQTATEFIGCFQAIPNSRHDIVLQDDGTVTMTLGAFRAATAFIGLGFSDD